MNAAKAIKTVRAAGRRMTPERKLLIRIISANAHLDASEIFLLAKEKNPKISLSTVYRAMSLLKELGIVAANALGEDHRHYEVHSDEHCHCVCLSCGRLVEIPLVDATGILEEESGFEIVGAKVELTGYCERCHKERTRKKPVEVNDPSFPY